MYLCSFAFRFGSAVRTPNLHILGDYLFVAVCCFVFCLFHATDATAAKSILAVFDCRILMQPGLVGVEGEPLFDRGLSVLRGDLTMECHHGSHLGVLVGGWICLVFYGLGIPLFAFLILYRYVLFLPFSFFLLPSWHIVTLGNQGGGGGSLELGGPVPRSGILVCL